MNGVSAPERRTGFVQITLGALATALMTGAVLWTVWESWQNALDGSRRASAQIATTIASQADETLGRAAAIAADLRQKVLLDPGLLALGNPRLVELIGDIGRAAPPGIGVSLANGEGLPVGASHHADLRAGRVSIAQQPSFRVHKESAPGRDAGVRISPPFMLNTRQVLAFVMSMAVRDERGQLLGVAAVSVPAGRVFQHLDPIRRRVASHIALVHRDGYVLSIAPDPGEAMPVRPASAWASSLDGRIGTTEAASPFSYRRAIVSHQELDGFPVQAVVVRDVADLFDTWRGERSERLIIYGAIIAGAIGLNLWLFMAVRGRLRAESALRESSEGRFHEFASIASDWFWETDAEHRFTYVSEGLSSHGVPPDSFIGKTRSERARAMPGPVSPRLIELEQHMDARRVIRGFVFDAALSNGERRWYEVSAKPSISDDGTFRGYRGVARDVTALQEAREQIAASEARLIDSINSMPIGYALWDARDRLVAWNRRYIEIWPTAVDLLRPGVTFAAYMEKAMRRAWTEIAEAELQERLTERIERHAGCGAPWTREFPDGRVIEFSEVRTTEGGIVSLYTDVTEDQRAVKRLADSEARFRDGIESMGQGFVLWGGDQKLVAWNSRAVELLTHASGLFVPGMDRATFLKEAARRLFPDKSDEEIRAMASARTASQQNGQPFEIATREGRAVVAMSHPTSDGGIVVTYNDVTEQRAVERALRKSEARFRDGIESMGQGFILWGPDQRLVAWNSQAKSMLPHAADLFVQGMERATLVIASARELFCDRSEAEIEALARERMDAHLLAAPYEIRTRDGRIVIATSHPTSDGGIVITYNDITELRAAEKALGDGAARFRDGIESMADGFSLWGADDRLLAWNSRFARFAPIEAEVLRPGIPYAECLDHLERKLAVLDPPWDWRAFIARRRRRRDALGAPIEVTNVHGTMIELIEQPTSEGGVVSIHRDVTDARRAAKRLADSEARFHDFADAASDWFWETGPDHRFTYVSAGLRKIGGEPDELVGLTRAEHARSVGQEPPLELVELQAILDRREPIRDFCFTSPPNEAGVRHTKELHGKPVFDAAGVFLGYRGVGRDVTQRIQQQAELERALSAEREMNAQQRRFVSIASHEFRTPLAVIDGATQRLMAKLADGNGDGETRKRLDRIRGAVSRMAELIERTLSSARLDDGRIAIETHDLDLGALLREVAERQRQISPSFDIHTESLERDLAIEGDAKLLEQVFTNLVSNAVKYSGRARRIEIVARATAGSVAIAVRDHGLGIHADEIPQLFTRFFRARSAMGIPGTGIGLHLVRELVQMHGGAVDVDSEIGVGTTFTVSLPRRQRSVPVVDAAQ